MAELDDEDFDDEEEEDDDADELAPEPTGTAQQSVRLVPSLWLHRPPTVYFDYPKELGLSRAGPSFEEPLGARKLGFKCAWERNCVKSAFFKAGFVRVFEDKRGAPSGPFNACWSKHLANEQFTGMTRFQKVNHFPGSWCIGRKDRLLRTLCKARRSNSTSAFSFMPEGYNTPAELKVFEARAKLEKGAIWIVKPPASSCGRGVRLITSKDVSQLPTDRKLVVQRYLAEPYLIDGRKFDLRL